MVETGEKEIPMDHRRPTPKRKRITLTMLTVLGTCLAVVLGTAYLVSAATGSLSLSCNPNPTATLNNSGRYGFRINCDFPAPAPVTKTVTATATVTAPTTAPTTVPTTAPTSVPTTPPTTVPTTAPTTPSGNWSCVIPIGQNCGPYSYNQIPWSNGYDTYVSNQAVDVHGTATVSANNPGDWQVVANLNDCGGCVQIYPDVQQLTNDWGAGGPATGSQDTPWRQLNVLRIDYNETSPQTGASYQFSPDVWGPGPWDIMFWVDTHGRCNEGAFGPTVLGHFTMDGQTWTAHQYGTEIILVLDGAGGPGTCAQQSSGSINIKAGLDWLWNNGFITGTTMSQLNTGWEITQSSGQTFTMNSYSISAS